MMLKTLSRLAAGSAAILALTFCGFAGPGESADAQAKDYGKLPAWNLPDAEGHASTPSLYRGKVLIVDFWATWCPPCKLEIPGFIEMQKKYGPQGLRVVGFSMDNDPGTHKKWLAENKVNYPSVYANTPEAQKVVQEFAKKIGPLDAIPVTLIVNRKGEIVFKHVGYAKPEEIEKIIEPLLKG